MIIGIIHSFYDRKTKTEDMKKFSNANILKNSNGKFFSKLKFFSNILIFVLFSALQEEIKTKTTHMLQLYLSQLPPHFFYPPHFFSPHALYKKFPPSSLDFSKKNLVHKKISSANFSFIAFYQVEIRKNFLA